jgi:TolB-like protein
MSPMNVDSNQRLRFGAFELDIGSRELRTADRCVRLQEQPFAILRMLLAQRGHVVTRDELRQELWPAGTFVDFEHSLNAAIKRLRAALGDDADNPRFVETIPRRGYRFIADPEDADVPDLGLTPPRVRLAVLPFSEVGAGAQDDYFSHGFTEEMISELGQRCRGHLGVISSHSTRGFKNTTATASEIGAMLRADYLLEGSVRRHNSRVRITARLVETSSETQLWVDTYEQPLTDWLSVQSEIAARIADSLSMELLPDDRVSIPYSPEPEAYQSYLKGRYHWQRTADTGAKEALHFYGDAVARDPEFAAAHAGLAIVEVLRASHYHELPRRLLERARSAADRALQLDATLAHAHVAIGDVKRLLLRDYRGARTSYATAIALNSSSESARIAHSRLLASLGRLAQAVREADLGREIDPHCLTANTLAAWARYAAGDYDAAADICRNTLEMDESYRDAGQLLGAALLASGHRKEALRVLESAVDVPEPSAIAIASLAHALGTMNDRSAAGALIARLEELRCRRYVSPYYVALAHTGLGEIDIAFEYLAAADDDRDPAVTNIAIDPRFVPLRADPRYARLLIQLGLSDFHTGHR